MLTSMGCLKQGPHRNKTYRTRFNVNGCHWNTCKLNNQHMDTQTLTHINVNAALDWVAEKNFEAFENKIR